jgi:hypothetical protein
VRWLERHSWWGLLGIAIAFGLFGVTDIAGGAEADALIPLSLTGMTLEELQAEGAASYRLFDFLSRINGWTLILSGAVMTAVLLFAFRRNEPWAWWTMWVLPIWSFGVPVFYIVAGTDPAQPPPPPMVSGPIVGVIAGLILVLSARRFFRSSPVYKE